MKTYSALLGALIVTGLATQMPQANAFGLGNLTSAIPGVGGSASASTVTGSDIDLFIKTAQDADTMIATSSRYIFRAIEGKEAIAKQEAELAAANAIADPAEKAAAINKIREDEATAVQKALASSDIQQKLAAMNKDQLKAFGNAAFTYFLGVLKDKQLADGSRALVTGVAANPMLLPRLAALKDVATSVSAQAVSTAKIGEGLVRLSSTGKIAALPKSASEDQKPVETL
ncbi:hypothetical protein [Caballeronia concitans]|uniref:DUF4142 domain-containing protein n=1 Tax=Caballeronia concitans TaxID=1777133 RepID=A0A658R3C9_9BURK|nr:hypothetical protein [Caballeronia concitans]KIG01685.1 hypothetical protein BurMR1_1270 [Burkholderia sp. MR1]SAL46612.1 hypothetical protein AWB72_04865 [Caballeronia concitans]